MRTRGMALGVGIALILGALLTGCGPTAPSGSDQPGTASTAPPASGQHPATVEVSGTTRPTLSWDAVPGAASYRLVVTQDDGRSWAWERDATSLVLGGGEIEDREGPGFALSGPAVALLFPLDAEGNVLGHIRVELPGP